MVMKGKRLDVALSLLLVAPEVWKTPATPGVAQLTWAIFWDSVQASPCTIVPHVHAHKQVAARILQTATDPSEFAHAQQQSDEIRQTARQWMEAGNTDFEWLITGLKRLIESQR